MYIVKSAGGHGTGINVQPSQSQFRFLDGQIKRYINKIRGHSINVQLLNISQELSIYSFLFRKVPGFVNLVEEVSNAAQDETTFKSEPRDIEVVYDDPEQSQNQGNQLQKTLYSLSNSSYFKIL